jgi:putative transcriptional regulator
MTHRSHPSPETLISYASGTLPSAIAGVVACHISICPDCRADAHRLDILGGLLLARIEAPPGREMLERRMARALSDPFLDVAPHQSLPAGPDDPVLPMPLAHHLGMTTEEIPWKRVVRGVEQYWVKLPEGEGQMRLLRIDPGKILLEHTHLGMELTLVLKGIYGDSTGQFRRGDVIEWSEETEHQPRVFGEEQCICLVGTERQPYYHRLLARLVRPILGF